MKASITSLALMSLFSLSATAPAIANDPCAPGFSPQIYQTCQAINWARGENHLAPLQMTPSVQSVAQMFAWDLQSRNTLTHFSADGNTPFSRMQKSGVGFGAAGENVAEGGDPSTVVNQMWMNSPEHRANMLNPAFHKIGVGIAGPFYVTDFTD